MSDRGSFCTEFVYCNGCFSALKRILRERVGGDHNQYNIHSIILKGRIRNTFFRRFIPRRYDVPIIAGFVKSFACGDEILWFDNELREEIEAEICHPVSIAILCESNLDGHKAVLRYEPEEERYKPKGENNEQ